MSLEIVLIDLLDEERDTVKLAVTLDTRRKRFGIGAARVAATFGRDSV